MLSMFIFLIIALMSVPDTKAVLLVACGINSIDATGEETMLHMVGEFRKNGNNVYFTEVPDSVMDVHKRSGLYEPIGERHFSFSARYTFEELDRKYA